MATTIIQRTAELFGTLALYLYIQDSENGSLFTFLEKKRMILTEVGQLVMAATACEPMVRGVGLPGSRRAARPVGELGRRGSLMSHAAGALKRWRKRMVGLGRAARGPTASILLPPADG